MTTTATFTRSQYCQRCNLLLHPGPLGALTDDFGRELCEYTDQPHIPAPPPVFAALDPELNRLKPMPKLAGYGYVEVGGVRYANSWVEPGRTIRLEL